MLDNLSTHTRKAATDWFGEEEGGWLWSRFTIHHTPKHGSWLNQAEIEIGLFSRQCLGKRRIASLQQLTAEAAAWNQRTNQAKNTIEWKFTRKKARRTLKYNHPVVILEGVRMPAYDMTAHELRRFALMANNARKYLLSKAQQ